MAIVYPVTATTRQLKHDYAQRLLDGQFRMLKNFVRRWHRTGITQDEYDNGISTEDLAGPVGETFVLPTGYKSRIAYTANLPRATMLSLFENDFDVTQDELLTDIGTYRRSQMDDTTFDADIDLDNVRT